MSTIVTRAGKGSPLTHNEVDANFTNLNTDKVQSGDTVAALSVTDLSADYSELAAIAATKAVTAVDVFVYDTSKDSDGGAWRKRTQGTSWYNEALNTATRGARREFPAVAVIVAETNKVTIYDGDDPALPMWMVFNENGTSLGTFWYPERNASALSAIAGQLLIASNGDTWGGLRQADFIGDRLSRRSAAGFFGYTPVSERNVTQVLSTISTDASVRIVNFTVNDVAMTVLPDAPIDPATGLPVPTIAVATAGGVSVITDSGAVYDTTIGFTPVLEAAFDDAGGLWWYRNSALFLSYATVSDYTAGDGFGDMVASSTIGNQEFDLQVGSVANALAVTQDSDLSIGGGSGLGRHYLNTSALVSAANTHLHALLTSTYNTGYMNGDIKGAFLSDTDDTDLVGSGELVTNGTFDTDVSGWTLVQSGGSSATLTQSSGEALITLNGSFDVGMSQAFTTVVGQRYVITQTMGLTTAFNSPTTGRVVTFIGTAINGSQNAQQEVFGIDGVTVTLTFVATATTTYVTIRSAGSGNITGAFTVDNVSVKLADADRSVNNDGLIVNGTVTRSPVATGADLVAYSGFSASNYLEQPYNAGLDFGTGDFAVMGWGKVNDAGGSKYIMARASHDGTSFSGSGIVLRFDGSEFPVFGISDDGFSTSDTVTYSTALTGRWSHIVGLRRGSNLELFVDGSLVGTTAISAATGSLNNSAATLSVGNLSGLLTVPMDGSLALLRISATAPTAEQIARIYNDEKHLFAEGAQATLAGTSDAVTALAHDSTTGLLHVGSSYGRSVFQGLRRVDAVAGAVGTAISAENGLVVSE